MKISLFRNLIFGWAGLVVSILLGLFVSPLVVHSLGKEHYGLWALAVSLSGQLLLLDLGVKNALVRYLPHYRQIKDLGRISATISSSLAISVVMAIVSLALTALFCLFAPQLFPIDPTSRELFRLVLVIVGLDTAVELAFGVYDGALMGGERYDLVNAVNVFRIATNAILLFIALRFNIGILGVATIALTVRVAAKLLSRHLFFRENPTVQAKMALTSWATISELLKYGLWACLVVLGTRLIYQTDSIVIGAYIGSVGVAIYAVPLILIEQFRNFGYSANTILTARLSALHSANEKETIRLLLLKWSMFSSILAIFIGAPLLVTGGDFILLWIGPDFAASQPILELLTLPFFLTLPSLSFTHYLFASNQHKTYAKLIGVEALVNLVLSIILVQSHGLIGVALGTLIPSILFRGVLLPWVTARLTDIPFSDYLRYAIIRCIPLMIVQVAVLYELRALIGSDTWPGFVLVNLAGVISLGLAAYLLYFDADDRAYLHRRLGLRAITS